MAALSGDDILRVSRPLPGHRRERRHVFGHNTLRLMVMGMEQRQPGARELDAMIGLLREALDAGALGLSSGLFTAPGSYAQPEEMIALCRVLERDATQATSSFAMNRTS